MKKYLVGILAGLVMVGPLAIDTYLPSFKAIGQTFEVGPLLVQQTLSVYLFTFAVMMLFHGTCSDSFGRRPVILASLAIYAVASLGAALAPTFGWLLVFRVMQGLMAGAGLVVGQALVRDKVNGAEAQRVLAYIMMFFGLAPAVAPILGGLLQVYFGWRSIFVFLGMFATLMFVLCYRSLPESLSLEARPPLRLKLIVGNYWKALRHPRFLLLALAAGIAFGGFGLYIGSAANFVMNILHLSETEFGWLFIPLIGGMVIGSAIAGRYAFRVSPKRLAWSGYAVMAAAAVLNVTYNYWFAATVPWAVLPIMLYALGYCIANPALTVMALDLFPNNRGLISSLQLFVQLMAFSLVSGILAPLLFDSSLNLSLGVLGGLAVSLLCWIFGLAAEFFTAPSVVSRVPSDAL